MLDFPQRHPLAAGQKNVIISPTGHSKTTQFQTIGGSTHARILNLSQQVGMMGTVHQSDTANRWFSITTMPTATRSIPNEDPEIAAMSDKEILAEVRAMFGSWADRDDITDTWLDELRDTWNDRLDDLYGDETNPV